MLWISNMFDIGIIQILYSIFIGIILGVGVLFFFIWKFIRKFWFKEDESIPAYHYEEEVNYRLRNDVFENEYDIEELTDD